MKIPYNDPWTELNTVPSATATNSSIGAVTHVDTTKDEAEEVIIVDTAGSSR